MQKENRKKDKEERKQELYSGGRNKELAWHALIEEIIFNKPVQTALWNNEEDKIKELMEPPKWKSNYDPSEWPNKWKKVLDFGHKWYPNEFGTQSQSKQTSVAVQFKFLFKQIQNEWFQEIKDTVTGQALTEIRKLKPEKVHMAKTVVKNLQGMGSSIDHTALEKALINVIMFCDSKIELKDLQITNKNCNKSFTDQDNPRDYFNGLEELRERLTSYYEEHGQDYSNSDVVSWDRITQRIIERLPALYSPFIMQMKVAVQHTAAIIRDSGAKFTDKEGKEITATDNLS